MRKISKSILVLSLILLATLASFATPPKPTGDRELALDTTRSGLLVMRISVNGREGNFIVDTGSEITLVDAPMLFLTRAGAGRPDTKAKGRPSFRVEDATICLCSGDDKAYFHMPVAVANLSRLQGLLGMRIDGLLGVDFLRKLGSVSIDFGSQRLTVHGR